MQQLSVTRAARREQHREVVSHSQLVDQSLVDLAVFDGAPGADIDDLHLSCLCSYV